MGRSPLMIPKGCGFISLAQLQTPFTQKRLFKNFFNGRESGCSVEEKERWHVVNRMEELEAMKRDFLKGELE